MSVLKRVDRSHIKWELSKRARRDLSPLRKLMSDGDYREWKMAFRDFFCEYINSARNCDEQGCNVYPLGGIRGGGKGFKVRWALPGMGKSGGLRIALAAFCREKRVKLLAVILKKDIDEDELLRALQDG
jgi:hypothetical protein